MKKLLFFIFAIFFLSGCIKIDPPVVEFIDSKITGIRADGFETEFYFNIDNPNAFGIDLSGYEYKVFVNDRLLISEMQKGFSLAPREKRQITIKVFSRYDFIADSFLSLIQSIMMGKNYFEYKIDGKAFIGSYGISIDVPINSSGRITFPKELLSK